VFPSEVAAEYWRRHGARFAGGRALRTDRFISWDTYKERYLSISSSLTPANKIARRLFAAGLCEEIESTPALPSIIPEAFAHRARRFSRSIAGMLPSLRYLVEDISAGVLRLPREFSADYQTVYERYRRYLDDHGLFEPAYLGMNSAPPDVGSGFGGKVCIIYPELIDDYDRYAEHLDSVDCIHAKPPMAYNNRSFATTIEEIDWLFDEISNLLSEGVHPEEIVVSAAGLESITIYITEAARLRSVPIDLRAGKAFTDYPQGALFSRIRDCVTKRFEFDCLKALLLDCRIPWKNRELNQHLVRFGVDARIGRNGRRDVWVERLKLRNETRLSGYYRSLHEHFTQIVEAPDFASLRSRVLDFVNHFLDARRNSQSGSRSEFEATDPGRRILEGVIDTLGPFEAIAEIVDAKVSEPLSMWLEYLADQIYVVRNRDEAVSIYPYRVTAGVHPKHHFVVNVADSSARVRHAPYPFIPMHVRQNPGENQGTDVTSAFLRAYSMSGEDVRFSYSSHGPGGAMLSPSDFVLFESENTPRGSLVSDNAGQPRPSSLPYFEERLYWSGTANLPDALYPIQRLGFTRAFGDDTSGLIEGDGTGQFGLFDDDSSVANFATHVASDRVLVKELCDLLRNDKGVFAISPTTLDSWSNCRFAFLINHLLRVEQREFTVQAVDALAEGKLLHEFAETLLTKGGDQTDADAVNALLETLSRQASSVFPQPYSLLLYDRLEKFRVALEALLENDHTVNPDGSTAAVETSYRLDIGNIELKGRIDRVFPISAGGSDESDEPITTYVLVDYKRSRMLTPGQVRPFESASSYQIPIYVMFVESMNRTVSGAHYYSFNHRKFAHVFSEYGKKSWFSRDELEQFKEAAKIQASAMADALEVGDFMTPGPSGGCERCGVRSICRQRYVVRRGPG
jgi:hypothetical protein